MKYIYIAIKQEDNRLIVHEYDRELYSKGFVNDISDYDKEHDLKKLVKKLGYDTDVCEWFLCNTVVFR